MVRFESFGRKNYRRSTCGQIRSLQPLFTGGSIAEGIKERDRRTKIVGSIFSMLICFSLRHGKMLHFRIEHSHLYDNQRGRTHCLFFVAPSVLRLCLALGVCDVNTSKSLLPTLEKFQVLSKCFGRESNPRTATCRQHGRQRPHPLSHRDTLAGVDSI